MTTHMGLYHPIYCLIYAYATLFILLRSGRKSNETYMTPYMTHESKKPNRDGWTTLDLVVGHQEN